MKVSARSMFCNTSPRLTKNKRNNNVKKIKLIFWACAGLLGATASVPAQHIDAGTKQLSQAEAEAVLNEFRQYRLPGDYCLQIEIVHKPRKSDDESHYSGTLWGTWIDGNACLRLEIGKHSTAVDNRKKFLIQSGKNPTLWRAGEDGKVEKIDKNNTEPFFEDLIFTPFDLQTPFLFWKNFKYESTKRSRGRPVHFFQMFPPENFAKNNAEIGSVRIGFDRAYNALVRVEVLDKTKRALKTFSLGRVQKVQEIYTFRELELRDDRSRDRDTLRVRSAAMRLRIDPQFFVPSALVEPPPSIPLSAFSILD